MSYQPQSAVANRHLLSDFIIDLLRPIYKERHFSHAGEVDEFVGFMLKATDTLIAPADAPKQPERDRGILAIIFYGSCLNEGMASASSTPDFYVIVDSYRQFYGRRIKAGIDRFLNKYFPPNIYRYKASKYSVITLSDLRHETSLNALDVYHVGRFSKRLAVAYVQDGRIFEALLRCCAQATEVALRRALPLLPSEFSRTEAVQMALRISYLGEPRVEAKDKIDKIYRSQEQFYEAIFGAALEKLPEFFPWLKTIEAGRFRAEAPVENRAEADEFVRRSRQRAYFRWPKYIWTVENWADYMASKVERTHGIKLPITDQERRFAWIFGWKYLWQLKRRKIFK